MHTRALLYPEGTGLWMHIYTPVLGLLNVLFQLLPAGYREQLVQGYVVLRPGNLGP